MKKEKRAFSLAIFYSLRKTEIKLKIFKIWGLESAKHNKITFLLPPSKATNTHQVKVLVQTKSLTLKTHLLKNRVVQYQRLRQI